MAANIKHTRTHTRTRLQQLLQARAIVRKLSKLNFIKLSKFKHYPNPV